MVPAACQNAYWCTKSLFWNRGKKGIEIYEVWFAPDHKMPYCNNKGTLFIIAINSDPCYIKIIILIIMELMIIIIILNTNSNFSKCYMNCPQVAICTDFLWMF